MLEQPVMSVHFAYLYLPNPDDFPGINQVRVPEMVKRLQTIHAGAKARCNNLKCIAGLNRIVLCGCGQIDYLSIEYPVGIPNLRVGCDQVIQIDAHPICNLAHCVAPLDYIGSASLWGGIIIVCILRGVCCVLL